MTLQPLSITQAVANRPSGHTGCRHSRSALRPADIPQKKMMRKAGLGASIVLRVRVLDACWSARLSEAASYTLARCTRLRTRSSAYGRYLG